MFNFFSSLFKTFCLLVISLATLVSCSSAGKFWSQWQNTENRDFEKLVTVEEVEVIPIAAPAVKPLKKKENLQSIKPKVREKKASPPLKKTKPMLKKKAPVVEKKMEIKNEPLKKKETTSKKSVTVNAQLMESSPFRVGQKTKIAVSYLNMTAGHLTLETKKMVKVNGRLSYHFKAFVQSRRAFSFIYSVEDSANTYVDVENLRPYTLEFLAKETKKIKESKTFFDWSKMRATYWSRKVKKGKKPKESKKTWNIVEGSQNFVSALFYLRTIDFSKNKTFSFPLADEGKNITLKGKVLGKEVIKTELGKMEAWLVEPEFHIKGSLTPVGKVHIWFKADAFQELVKLETQLKFGSIVGEIVR